MRGSRTGQQGCLESVVASMTYHQIIPNASLYTFSSSLGDIFLVKRILVKSLCSTAETPVLAQEEGSHLSITFMLDDCLGERLTLEVILMRLAN